MAMRVAVRFVFGGLLNAYITNVDNRYHPCRSGGHLCECVWDGAGVGAGLHALWSLAVVNWLIAILFNFLKL